MNLLINDDKDWLEDKTHMVNIIEDVVKEVLEEEKLPMDVEVSITLTDDPTIKDINYNYRNIKEVTDVLSFPQIDWAEDEPNGYTRFPGEDMILGDIVISVDRLISQAKEYNHSLDRELGFLVAHSMFHLLGYDHMSKADEEEMISKQEKVLGRLGLKR
ncbi:MAG: rRNA maturation RNase YbeY [Epulopiscium sp.]|nr:rRNA maturation RNase YbeY [Candidatus Epulonipiscium sp.]